ncbi:MAG TPA: thiamine diphosphokinase, partial [Syntrophales bacterium]|nr:thiamine diphosphokinase [Syntrophales bacterium]
MSTTIFVVSGGVMDDIGFLSDEIRRAENPIIICADGAAQKLKVLDIVPDYIVGDMDSVEEETLRYFETRGSQISRYSKDKDETDTQLALEFAFGMNPDRIRIFGALGGRVDHTLANISLLVLCAKRKIDARIVDRWCELFVIDGSCVIEGRHGETVS